MPLPLGSGNCSFMNRLVRQPSTALLPMVDFLMLARLTLPSPAMTNFTVILPERAGFVINFVEG